MDSTARHSRAGKPRDAERGFTLAAVLVLVTIMMVFVAYTVPREWSAILQRDRERQTIYAMQQYARACREFARKHNNTFPVSVDQLKEARTPRFIRGVKGEFVDPLTGQVDWLVIPQAAALAPPPVNAPPVTTPPVTTSSAPTTSTPTTSSTDQEKPALPGVPIKDYAGGPFVGVRPPKTGKSMLTFNGNDTYETWMYTALDLQRDIDVRNAGLATVWK